MEGRAVPEAIENALRVSLPDGSPLADGSPSHCACVTLRHCRLLSTAKPRRRHNDRSIFNHVRLPVSIIDIVYLYMSMVSIMEDSEDSQFYRNMTIYLKTREMVSLWTKNMWWMITLSIPSYILRGMYIVQHNSCKMKTAQIV